MAASKKEDGPALKLATDEPDPVEAIEARRAERRARHEKARREQLAKDLEALEELEVEHGDDSLVIVKIDRWKPGFAANVVCRMPTSPEKKRYAAAIKKKNPDEVAASEQIARACLLYPERSVFDEMCSAFTFLPVTVGNAVLRASRAAADEEGKD